MFECLCSRVNFKQEKLGLNVKATAFVSRGTLLRRLKSFPHLHTISLLLVHLKSNFFWSRPPSLLKSFCSISYHFRINYHRRHILQYCSDQLEAFFSSHNIPDHMVIVSTHSILIPPLMVLYEFVLYVHNFKFSTCILILPILVTPPVQFSIRIFVTRNRCSLVF